MVDALIGIGTIGFIVLVYGSALAENCWSDNWPFGHDSEWVRAAKVIICGIGFLLVMLILVVIFSAGGGSGREHGYHHPGDPNPGEHHHTGP